MAIIEADGIVDKVDNVIGGVMALGLDILAIGTIVVSLKPAFEAIKSQSWSDFPMISVPILISSWFLFGDDNKHNTEITPLNLTNHLLADGIYIKDVALSSDLTDDPDDYCDDCGALIEEDDDEEEADTGGYY